MISAAIAGLGISAARPAIAQTASLSGITSDVFECMKANTRASAGYVVYQGGSSGRIRVFAAGVGQVGEVSYSFNAGQGLLNLTYVRGPATFAQIRGGLEGTANRCKA